MGSTRTAGRRSRLGGEPTTLAPAAPAGGGQMALALADDRPPRARAEVLPGAVHVPEWLDLDAQRALVADFRRWAEPPAGLRHPRMPSGQLMSIQAVCLGWHWRPYGYSRTADDTDGTPVKPLPPDLAALARAAVGAAYEAGPVGAAVARAARCEAARAGSTDHGGGDEATKRSTFYGADSTEAGEFAPDAAIVNLYGPGAKLGLHQDGEEPAAAPVVTISLGDTCTFRMAGVDRRTGPFTDVELRSGDLLVFGGPTRRIFHGVPKVLPGTAPEGLGLPPGRLSITVRETGLAG